MMMSTPQCRHEEVARSDGDAKAAEAAEAAEQVKLVRHVMPYAQPCLCQHQPFSGCCTAFLCRCESGPLPVITLLHNLTLYLRQLCSTSLACCCQVKEEFARRNLDFSPRASTEVPEHERLRKKAVRARRKADKLRAEARSRAVEVEDALQQVTRAGTCDGRLQHFCLN